MTRARHRAREAALQALYLWEIGRTSPGEALDAYFDSHAVDLPEGGRSFVTRLVEGTVGGLPGIDRLIAAHSAHWRVERLAVVDRLILRLAVWELQHGSESPAAVVIDEALELARTFSGEDAVRFINGVLDAVRKTLDEESPDTRRSHADVERS